MKFKLFSYEEVDSTNNIAMNLIKTKNYNNGFIVASSQKKGRGRRGRKWISKKGNLFMTVFFEISKKLSVKKIINLNILIIKNIISKKIRSILNIKKPNDIFINKKKVCGILQEMIFKNDKKFLIIGIGINVINSPNVTKYETTYLNNYSKKKLIK